MVLRAMALRAMAFRGCGGLPHRRRNSPLSNLALRRRRVIPKKPVLRRDPRVVAGFRERSCAKGKPGDYLMNRRATAVAVTLAALAIFSAPSFAQQGQPQLPNLRPPPPAPIKPYQAVALTPPAPLNDPSFIAFRKQLADAAAHKDRAALSKLVVAQKFFWLQDKDLADPKKSGFDNLANAVGLDAPDAPGWDSLASFANEPTAAESPDQKGVFCGP